MLQTNVNLDKNNSILIWFKFLRISDLECMPQLTPSRLGRATPLCFAERGHDAKRRGVSKKKSNSNICHQCMRSKSTIILFLSIK